MDIIIRAAALALTAAVPGLLIRRKNPELTSLLSMAAIALILAAGLHALGGLRELLRTVRTMLGGGENLLLPVLKCMGTAIVTRIAADLCRDASQSALASAVELTGSFCALGIALPLILAMLKQIGGLL